MNKVILSMIAIFFGIGEGVRPAIGSDVEELEAALLQVALEDSAADVEASGCFIADITEDFENKITANTKLMPIAERVNACPNNTDVHQLDYFVLDAIQELLNVGEILGTGRDDLTLLEVSQQVTDFVTKNNYFITDLGQEVSYQQLLDFIKNHFSGMDAEIATHPKGPQIAQLFSRLWTGCYQYLDTNAAPLTFFFLQVADNYTTQGGCLAGRINRGFIAYIKLLNTMIND